MTSSRTDLPADVDFEPEFLAALREIYEEKILFNQWLGLRVDSIKATGIDASLMMKPELVGHFAYNRIHGGVISAVLDVMGSLAVMAALGAKHMDESPAKRIERFTRHSTIDMRVDFLRPGIGERFLVHTEAVRVGARVSNARMEFRSADGKLLSTGTAAYLTS
jgi:uncharacterized protein (TIGR00369 family)